MKRRNLLKALFGAAVTPVAALAAPVAPLAKIGQELTSPIFMVDDASFQRNILHSNLCPEIVDGKSLEFDYERTRQKFLRNARYGKHATSGCYRTGNLLYEKT